MMNELIRKRTLFRHPLAAVGGALASAGGFLFIILLVFDLTVGSDNPYRSLVTFVIAPAIALLGALLFLIAVGIQIRAARKRGEQVRFNLSIDPTDPAYMRNLWVFLGLTAALVLVLAYSGYRAYDATDSNAFCGKTCHEVMEPQFVTYQNSPHARVHCVDCHIGPGASFYVKSKFDGIRQLWATALNTYSRPIETPVKNLRPAQETCEGCHWPQQFWGEKLAARTYYKTDSANSPWTINLLLKVGGGNPRTGKQEGIHWHMLAANKVEYVATDEKRQVIPWIRVTNHDGTQEIFKNSLLEQPNLDDPLTEIRTFDCMDCHNRPSHTFLAPATALNLAISTRKISPDLPYVRQMALDLLNATYSDRREAWQKISDGFKAYYMENYPDLATSRSATIDSSAEALLAIYRDNFFPEMQTDYRARENNLSHFVNDGCFRCHDPNMQNEQGETLSNDCATCHVIVAQGPSEHVGDLENNIAGLEFKHPEDIDDAWKEAKCTECHTPDSGY